jgi:hypothetical protein
LNLFWKRSAELFISVIICRLIVEDVVVSKT